MFFISLYFTKALHNHVENSFEVVGGPKLELPIPGDVVNYVCSSTHALYFSKLCARARTIRGEALHAHVL